MSAGDEPCAPSAVPPTLDCPNPTLDQRPRKVIQPSQQTLSPVTSEGISSAALDISVTEDIVVTVPENCDDVFANDQSECPMNEEFDEVDGVGCAAKNAEMTVAPKESDLQNANKINGNVMENTKTDQETKDLCPQGSPNRAIFEFKHQDTDVEESPQLKRKNTSHPTENKFNKIVEDEPTPATGSTNYVIRGSRSSNINLNLSQYGRGGRRNRRQQQDPEEEYDSDGLQKIIDSSIMEQDWLKVESDGLDDQSYEGASDEPPALETMDTGSEEGVHQARNPVASPTKLNSSIHQLLNAAEHLVKPTPLPSPIVSPRAPISFNVGGSRSRVPPKSLSLMQVGLHNESQMKEQRIQHWLASQRRPPALLDSCDASGEMTTGESDGDSSSDSADCTLTAKLAKDLPQSLVSTPVASENQVNLLGSEPSKVSANIGRNQSSNSPINEYFIDLFDTSLFCNRLSRFWP